MNTEPRIDIALAGPQVWDNYVNQLREHGVLALERSAVNVALGKRGDFSFTGAFGEVGRASGQVVHVEGNSVLVAFSASDRSRLVGGRYFGDIGDAVLASKGSKKRAPSAGWKRPIAIGVGVAKDVYTRIDAGFRRLFVGPEAANRRKWAIRALVVIGIIMVWRAMSGDDEGAEPEESAAAVAGEDIVRSTREIPDTAGGQGARWVLSVLNGAELGEPELNEHVHPDALEVAGGWQAFRDTLAGHVANGPYIVVGWLADPTELTLNLALQNGPDSYFSMYIRVSGMLPYLVTELQISPR